MSAERPVVEWMAPTKIVIVGAGECGANTAIALRELGYGGRLVLIGVEAHDPYERPPLSKRALVASEAPPPATVLSATRRETADIEFLASARVVGIDRAARCVVVADGGSFEYDRLVLATGAQPRMLTISGAHHALLLRTYDDSIALRERLGPGVRLGVVGGGFIGLEVAAAARAKGCAVTVVEYMPRVLSRAVPAEIAAEIASRHAAAGVAIRCGVSVLGIEPVGDEYVISLDTGLPVECDVVVAGVGASPVTDLAATAGLAIDNGISVDEYLRTSDPYVYAAGDCCSFPHTLFGGRRVRLEAWRNAHDQARAVARNLLGYNEIYRAVPWFWSDQYELGIQIAGLPDEAATEVVRQRFDGAMPVSYTHLTLPTNREV